MARIETLALTVKGKELIHCVGCENRIENVISNVSGVIKVKADHTTQEIRITLDHDSVSLKKVREKLDFMGYQTN